jgi:hypothetical protein
MTPRRIVVIASDLETRRHHLAVQLQQPEGIAQDDLTLQSQFQRRRRLEEQPLPEQVLQPLDLQGNGGLSEMQPLGGLGEPAAFHHRDEAAHEVEVDIGHMHQNKEYSLTP